MILLGLTRENLERLPQDKPILVRLEEIAPEIAATLVIFHAGESEIAFLMEGASRLSIGELVIDPKLVPDAPPPDA